MFNKKSTGEVPKLADFHEYTKAAGKLAELESELSKVQSDISNAMCQRVPQSVHADAESIIASNKPVSEFELGQAMQQRERDLAPLIRRRDVLREAIGMQREIVRRALYVASRRAVEAVKPAYFAHVRELGELLDKAVAVNAEIAGIISDLEAEGFLAGFLHPMTVGALNVQRYDASDPGVSVASRFRAEAHEMLNLKV